MKDKPVAPPVTIVPRPVDRENPLATLARDGIASLDQLKVETMACRECPIGEFATQSVIGEGHPSARLMLVGEQPGDQEDVQGHPFVGPAGRLLARALEQAGIPADQVFVSNAVKHFKFELRGKRRIHKSRRSGRRPPVRTGWKTRSLWSSPRRWWRWAPSPPDRSWAGRLP
jgi:uracil-DNA glycosylase